MVCPSSARCKQGLPLGIITLTKQAQNVGSTAAGAAVSAGAGEVEVTREMREAGAAVIERWHGVVDSVFLAGEVYSAMDALAIREHSVP
jgi:hypothetical protein